MLITAGTTLVTAGTTLVTADTEHHIEECYQVYLSLSPYEQCVLKLLAVIYRPLGVSKLNKLLTQVGRNQCFSSSIRIKGLTAEHRLQLIEQGMISQDRDGIRLNPLLSNKLTWICVKDHSYRSLIDVIETIQPIRTANEWYRQKADSLCLIRDAYFIQGNDDLELLMEFDKNPQVIEWYPNEILIELYFMPFNLDIFLGLSDRMQYHSFAIGFAVNKYSGHDNRYLLSLLELVQTKNPNNSSLAHLCAEMYLNALRFDDIERIISPEDNTCYGLQINAAALMLQGNFEQAEPLFKKALAAKNKYARRKKQYLTDTFGLLYKLCLIVLGSQKATYYDSACAQIGAENSDQHTNVDTKIMLSTLYRLTNSLSSGDSYKTEFYFLDSIYKDALHSSYLAMLLHYLGVVWCGENLNKTVKKSAYNQLKLARDFFSKNEILIFSILAEQIIVALKLKGSSKKVSNKADAAMVYFPTLVSRKEEWDLALEKLIALSPAEDKKNSASTSTAAKPTRLIWEMLPQLNSVSFKAREQKKNTKGWSKGRIIALKRLSEETESFSYLTDADKKMCQAINVYQSWDYYRSLEYCLDGSQALIAAKDVDNLFLDGDLEHPIDLLQKDPELLVSEQKKQLLLSIADLPSNFNSEDTFTIKEASPYCYTFTLFNASHLKVAEIVGEGGLMIPAQAKAKVLESVAAIAPLLNIQSDMNELDTGLEKVDCDEHLVINIQPFGEGLEFTCVVMPFGDKGPAFKPMMGNVKLTTELEGRRIVTQRDLVREQLLLDALDEHCPPFLAMPDNVLAIDDAQNALEALERLEQVISQEPKPFLVRLRWPKGKKINLTKPLERQHLALAVGKPSEWFDITGELAVNEDEVIELRKLLDLISAASGRFVPLDSGQILALSQDLKERLDLINQATDGGKFHPLASSLIEEATTGMRMKTIHAWKKQAKSMHESNDIVPVVPSTLQAQLRDYQQEGFDWMSRLAHWKAGACLADDMGLGKTLQALALLLSRAANGPSLVIAPTSVCFNWQQEALKFAPTLNIRLFSDANNSDYRKQLLDEVTQFDCVIISYGLLQRESKLLAQVHWHTIVAEAQALKNPLAKRTQAAYALKGDFKVITTGTPIENNLTELWSLFRFITPGLLGNIKRFGERYALPIENVKEDKLAARKASLGLKTLIKPFILRRMKNQVLKELPSRTDINVHVELSAKEQDFYEALRRNAVDNIASASKNANEGEQRIKMLAELVKLRQACCNPKLIIPETPLPSAKLDALGELLDELQQNSHKALIFSQFVGHLQLIKHYLDQRGISYQYLDGSTSQKQRQTRVNAFQGGEGDVFLISLKAGGSGLNLTAADYVIHMDPWWNPAVEEQASDRAHRIGQQRPVTIYRLIAKNTIEERIVALHEHKRNLADKLLAGNEQASKLSVDDVLNMLKENF